MDEGWINGGFFVIEPKFFRFIKNDKTYLEREPLENLCKKNNFQPLNILVFGSAWIRKEIKKILRKF